MPKLWNETIEAHRTDVREAILNATAALAAKQGLLSVTMSQVAEETGIGRATLYKYFASVEDILTAWHERQMNSHFEQLMALHNQAGEPAERLATVLQTYGLIVHEYHGTELAAFGHKGEHAAHAEQHLHNLIRDLLAEAAKVGAVRKDVAPSELASYCLAALSAANNLPSKVAVRRLVTVILAGLQPPT